MLVEAQPLINAQDKLSVTEFMRKHSMLEHINKEVFIAMAKSLNNIDPDKLSMTIILMAMNRFLNELNGLQSAFLDANQPDWLCTPMVLHINARVDKVITWHQLRRLSPTIMAPSNTSSCAPMRKL